ncbi:MAG: tRNA dihydrouridine synthase DusB [Nevskiaceae bacterium]
MRIGQHLIAPAVILAPMAGVTDRPFRQLCRRLGAGLAVSEMTTSDPRLWHTEKSRLRMDHRGEDAPIAVQIAGYDPAMMAAAAIHNVEQGAQIIDLNMGCPAKKVCRVDAGSALLKDEGLVAAICGAVARAVPVPVSLKIRTGYDRTRKNAVTIAKIAQDSGIAAVTVHGRTREDHYEGEAEYETLVAVKQAVRIPVIANGDVMSPEKAAAVLRATGADALMVGRGALGNPWIFKEIYEYLATGRRRAPPALEEVGATLLSHLDELHEFYGPGRGVRVARKHIQWYCQDHRGSETLWLAVNRVECATAQRALVAEFFASGALARAA